MRAMSERILVLGSGGREHALAWRLARDPGRPGIHVAPGNDGMALTFTRHAVRETDPAAVVELARRIAATLVVVGPEAPLAAGVSDALVAAGIPVSGASAAGAQLESSKWFAKQIMREAAVPTARAEMFSTLREAEAALDRFGPPWVVKADGLAAGKGVLVSDSRDEARAFLAACLEGGRFGDGGHRVVLEEFLAGEEASVIAICDGERHVLLPAARDYKRAFDADAGPNTGGMGSFAPTPAVTPEVEDTVSAQVITPVLRALAARGTPYRGALYAGLMLTAAGPRVIEFNARFGDPETQSILPLLGGSLGTLLASAAKGAIERDAVTRMAGAAVTLALVDEGYPDAVRGGGVIEGLGSCASEVTVFHAGTRQEQGGWVVRGGRAAYLTATGSHVEEARARVMAARARLSGTGWRSRGDIAAVVAQPMRSA
ncbi:MAG: phosphoribosylamine--glycine ligase [Candidatus Eisenbacteria bacterium]|nr:phosphoribosylamine--glycine ligase [Candidatus Eisenbacteria bacterium]